MNLVFRWPQEKRRRHLDEHIAWPRIELQLYRRIQRPNPVAPIGRASFFRGAEVAIPTIDPAPNRRAQNMVARPIGPAPATTIREPTGDLASVTACKATESGSTSAPSSSLR